MNAILDQFICATKEFCCNNDDRGGSIAYFLVLLLGKFNQNASSRVFDIQQRQNSGTVISNRDILSLTYFE